MHDISAPATPHLEDLTDRIRPRMASSVLLWGIGAFFLIFLIWAALAQVDRTVRGMGRIVPSSKLQVVSNLEGGIIEAILVKSGQLVAEGAPLVRLDQTQSGAEYSRGRSEFSSLNARISRLEAEVNGTSPVFEGEVEQIAIERGLYAARMADLNATLAAARARVTQSERAVAEAEAVYTAKLSAKSAADSEYAMIKPLVERGIEPRMTLVQTEARAAQAAAEVMAASASISRARSSIAEAQASLSQQRQDWQSRAATELATARAELLARQRTLPALADRVQRTTITAPMSGKVNRVLVNTIGGTIRPGEPIAEIVPSDDALLVEAMVKPRDIAWIYIDQPARINITAYDSAVYGSFDGKVISISPDTVTNERTQESFYTVKVRTTGATLVDKTGRKLTLGPGMEAEVSLMGDKRSVLDYLLTPITRLGQRALRE
jgi:adhesin transport system membrane fusion protein